MPITLNAQVSPSPRNAASATHPFGVGTGWTPKAPDRTFEWAASKDGAATFREVTRGSNQPIQGSNTVRFHSADKNGVFDLRFGTNGDALHLKVNFAEKSWHIERHVDGKELAVDPEGLLDAHKAEVAFYVTSILGGSKALEAGPGVASAMTVRFEDGAYRFADVPRTGHAQTSQMDQSLPSMASQVPTQQAPVGGTSTLQVRLGAADARAGRLAELDRAALSGLGLPKDVETGVLKMADKVVKSVDQGSWLSLTRFADADHKQAQVGRGMGVPQYVAELLGLHSVGNSLSTGVITDDDLNRVRDLSFSKAERSGNIVTLTGKATVSEGSGARTLRTSIDIDISSMKLTGGLG